MTTREFIDSLANRERDFFQAQDKAIRDKYYAYVCSALKNDRNVKCPSAWYEGWLASQLTPYKVIAKKLGIEKSYVRVICEEALDKMRQIIKENPQKYDFFI